MRGNGALSSRALFANEVGGTETKETSASSFVHTKTSFYPITPFIRFRVDLQQGGPGNGKIDPGSKKNLRPLGLDLPTYVIRHTSIYGIVTYVASGTRGNHGAWFPQQCQRFPHHKCESHHHTTTIRHPRNECSCSFSVLWQPRPQRQQHRLNKGAGEWVCFTHSLTRYVFFHNVYHMCTNKPTVTHYTCHLPQKRG